MAGTKIILKNVLARYLPSALYERPKHGFESPIALCLSGALKDWAEDLLDPAEMRADALLDPALVQQKWGLADQ
jgi:asparagine synthase (glutamine-hydrolysing)